MEKSDKKTWTILSPDDLNRLLPWLGVMAIVSGYLHTDIIFRHFDIPHWLYFNIEDYLTTSLGRIVNIILFSVFVSLLSLFLIKNFRHGYIEWLALALIIAIGFYIAHLHSYENNAIGWVAVVTYFTAAFILNIPYNTDEDGKRFNKDATLAVFLFITATLAVISLDAKSMIKSIDSHHANSCMLVDLELVDGKYADREFAIMGSNTRYFFLREKKTGRVEIINADKLMNKGISYYRKNDCP